MPFPLFQEIVCDSNNKEIFKMKESTLQKAFMIMGKNM